MNFFSFFFHSLCVTVIFSQEANFNYLPFLNNGRTFQAKENLFESLAKIFQVLEYANYNL